MSSVCTALKHDADAFNPNVVKVVLGSAAICPCISAVHRFLGSGCRTKMAPGTMTTKMPGLPALVCRLPGFLFQQYTAMQPCALEGTEALEQLRALWYGVKIHMAIIDEAPGHGVDTPDDVARVEAMLQAIGCWNTPDQENGRSSSGTNAARG